MWKHWNRLVCKYFLVIIYIQLLTLSVSGNTVPSLTSQWNDERFPWVSGGEINKDKSNILPMNSAFVFIKPHANNENIQSYVKSKLLEHGLSIVSEFDISGSDMDEKKLIDRHYYAIASKATILEPHQMNVPESKFETFFGESWNTVLSEKRAVNAMQACEAFECHPTELDVIWKESEKQSKVIKLGGGFYCGLLSYKDKQPLYVFNAFFMSMRSKFVGDDKSIHCYEVKWSSNDLSWSDFRGKLLGSTDPSNAIKGSIRRTIYQRYKKFGLTSKPNKSDNGVHASASPFEGLVEKMNWMKKQPKDDEFGKLVLQNGISKKYLETWSKDPRLNTPDGNVGSLFDYLEDMDASLCLDTLKQIRFINK